MATKYLSPFSGRQFIDANGNPYASAKLFTYVAGTSTKVTTYKDSAGVSSHANPIVLNTRGEPADGSGVSKPIWTDGGGDLVKYVLAPSNDTDPPASAIAEWDSIPSLNDVASTLDQWEAGTTPTYISASSFSVAGDQTSTYEVGRRIKATVTAGTRYGVITATAYTTLTTVTVSLDFGNLDSGMSDVWYGLLSASNHSIPTGAALNFTNLTTATPLVFEGATSDAYETTLAVTDPTADRTATLQNQTGTISLCDPIMGASRGLTLKNNATNPTYQLDLAATAIVLHDTSNNALQLQTWSVTIDITASGANGLDTGAEGSSTWYYVWAIYDGTNKRGLLSTSSTAPTMPSGYTYKALVGEVYNDGSSNFLTFNRLGGKVFYPGRQSVLSNGADTTETAIVISAAVPPNATNFKCYGQIQRAGTGNVKFRVVTAVDYVTFTIDATDQHQIWLEFPNLSQTLYYICSTTGFDVDLWVQGYET